MRIGANNIFQNTSFVNNGQRPFANARLNGAKELSVSRKDQFEQQSQPKSILEDLMSRKQQILEQKYSMMGKTIEKGGNIQDIKAQMDAYDEQLKNIDEQIKAEIINQKNQEEDSVKDVSEKTPQTKEEAESAKMQSLMESSSSMEQAELVHNVKLRMEGEVNTLKSEMSVDSGTPLASKTDRVAQLTEKINATQEHQQEMVSDTNDKLIENPTASQKEEGEEEELAAEN